MKKITIWLVSLFIGMVILASIIFSAEENGIKSYLNKIPKEEDIEQQSPAPAHPCAPFRRPD